jgi:glycosyltransferase involved in cell wall biosynthesis
MKLAIIIPAYNEEAAITGVLADLVTQLPQQIVEEIIVVDDHSTDATAEAVFRFRSNYPGFNIQVIANSAPRGFANALRLGISKAKGELIAHVMADGCDRVNDITAIFDEFKKSNLDMVSASRYTGSGARKGGPILKAVFSRFVGLSLYRVIKIPTRDCSNAFKVYRKEIFKSISLKSDGFEVSMELCLKAYLLGYRIKELATIWSERERGSSSFNIFKESRGYIKLYLWAIFTYFRQLLLYRP